MVALLILAIPLAAVAWTFAHEELLGEVREWFATRSQRGSRLYALKFFYLFTREYCLSRYLAVGLLVMTRFKLLYADWRGYVIAGLSLVWIANIYMSLYGRIRLDIKRERVEIAAKEDELTNRQEGER